MTMYGNTVLHPATSPRAIGLDVAIVLPLVEIYPGAKRIADGKSVSNVSSYLSERQADELPNLTLFARLFGGDRSEVIEGKRNLDGWVAATMGSNAIATDNRMPFVGAVQSLHQRMANALLKKYVHDEMILVPCNDVGKAISMLENLRQKINNYMNSQEYKALSKGKKLDIRQIAVNMIAGDVMLEDEIAAITRDGKTLAVNKNYAAIVKALAGYYDVDPETLDMYLIMAHEMAAHGAHKIKSESELESFIRDFFAKIAKKESDGPTITIPKSDSSKLQLYLDLAKIARIRLKNTRKNYGILAASESELAEYIREAVEEEGMDYEEAVAYAEAKVKENSSKESDSRKSSKAKDAKDNAESGEDEESEEGDDEGEGEDSGEGESSEGTGSGE